MSRAIRLLATGLLALVFFESATAQIRSTPSGGRWDLPDSWVGGVVPTAADNAVVVSGARVESNPFVGECADLTIESGGELAGRVNVHGDLLNQGTILNANPNVWGSVTNEGSIEASPIYVRGDLTNLGEWGAASDFPGFVFPELVWLFGDQRRTVRAQNANVDISVGRNIDFFDPIPPRVVLEGENYFPMYHQPARGGDLVVVAPGAHMFVQSAALGTFAYEHGFYMDNYGRVTVVHRPDPESELPATGGHGAYFDLTPGSHADSFQVTAFGHQSPESFPNALLRYWKVQAWQPSAGATFNHIQFTLVGAEISDTSDAPLLLFHSADEGVTWTELPVESLDEDQSVNARGLDHLVVQVNGDLPISGLFTLARSAPIARRASLTIQIIGRREIRLGGPEAEYLVQYQNTGPTPVYRGLVGLTTDGGVYIERIVTSSPGDGTAGANLGQRLFSPFDDSTSAVLMTPDLAPGESRTFSAFLKAVPVEETPGAGRKRGPLQDPGIEGAVAAPNRDGFLKRWAAASLEELIADPCFSNGDPIDKIFDDAWDAAGVDRSESSWWTAADAAASGLEDGGHLVGGATADDARGALTTFGEAIVNGLDRYENRRYWGTDCGGPEPPEGGRIRLPMETVGSFDPNAKVGPAGAGERGFIASGGTFTYKILFENLAEATAPAYRIVIVDTLSDAFAAETVQRTRESHPGFSFTREENILRWEVEGIELPPNVNPPEGEGFVEFTVETAAGLESGTELPNRAEIIFDLNDPILTNTHLNTLDLLPPATTMIPLSTESVGDSLTVAWTTDDGEDGSGSASTAFFVSVDGGPFTAAGITAQNSVRVGVSSGHTYAFYALSRDLAGNSEIDPPEAVSTSVIVAAEDEAVPFQFALGQAYPNPFNPSTTISFDLAQTGRVSLRLYNVLGQRVARYDWGEMSAGRFRRTLDLSQLASGVYFYELSVSGMDRVLFRAVDKAILVK